MSKKALPAHEIGSGNIFADLGLPNAEEHQLKAALVVQLSRLIKERKLSQVDAAKLLVDQFGSGARTSRTSR